MSGFHNILLVQQAPQDRGALRLGIRLANQHGAKLTIVRVLQELSWPMSQLAGQNNVDLEALLEAEAQSALEAAVRAAKPGDLDVDVRVLWGKPANELVLEVLRHKHDLLVKVAGSIEPSLSERLFGAVDLQLMRKCPCPVWIVKAEEKSRRLTRIVTAVDPDPDDPIKTKLNHRIIELGLAHAARSGAKLTVLNAWRFEGESLLRGPRGGMTGAEVDALVEEMRVQRQDAVEALLADHDLSEVECEVELVRGVRHEAIANYVASHKAGLLVMGTVSRTGLSDVLIGNTAENVLQLVTCSVLAVKPEGFVSPVELS